MHPNSVSVSDNIDNDHVHSTNQTDQHTMTVGQLCFVHYGDLTQDGDFICSDDMKNIDTVGFASSQVHEILKVLSRAEGISVSETNRRIFDRTGISLDTTTFRNRKSWPERYLFGLQSELDTLPAHKKHFIFFELNPSLQAHGRFSELAFGEMLRRQLFQWINPERMHNSELIKNCCNEKGHYIVIRRPSDSSVSISRMRIKYDHTKSAIPSFVTIRGEEGSVAKVVKGNIFQTGKTVYAIGRIKNDDGIRFTRLNYRSRIGRTDFIGLRTGHSSRTGKPYSYLVYCYQIKRHRGLQLHQITSERTIDSPLLNSEINNFAEILSLLKVDKLTDNGLQPTFFDGAER